MSFLWPGLKNASSHETYWLPCERAIWGKVHKAGSDYRWIAYSRGFTGRHHGIEKAISIGLEDDPKRAYQWFSHVDRCYAISCYPSRAVDAAGRSGFLEKQIIEWCPEDVPAAVGAFILLPRVASFTDALWIGTAGDASWQSPTHVLDLPSENVPAEAEAIEPAVREGLSRLRKIPETELAGFYGALLESGSNPDAGAALLSLPAVTPELVAALLLPLPDTIGSADRRWSIAGGVASRSLGDAPIRGWNGLIHSGAARSAIAATPNGDWGRMLARAVHRDDPYLSRVPQLGELLAFARSRDRWLPARHVPKDAMLCDLEYDLLRDAIRQVLEDAGKSGGLPELRTDLREVRARHLRQKADVIRAAALMAKVDLGTGEFVRNVLQEWQGQGDGILQSRVASALSKLDAVDKGKAGG